MDEFFEIFIFISLFFRVYVVIVMFLLCDGMGSGFIVLLEGLILINYYVVEEIVIGVLLENEEFLIGFMFDFIKLVMELFCVNMIYFDKEYDLVFVKFVFDIYGCFLFFDLWFFYLEIVEEFFDFGEEFFMIGYF